MKRNKILIVIALFITVLVAFFALGGKYFIFRLVQRAVHIVGVLGIVEFLRSDGADFLKTSHNLHILEANK